MSVRAGYVSLCYREEALTVACSSSYSLESLLHPASSGRAGCRAAYPVHAQNYVLLLRPWLLNKKRTANEYPS